MRLAVSIVVLVLVGCESKPVGWRARALAFERGHGGPRDYRKAAEVYAQACAGGDAPVACRYLGLARVGGRGVPLDARAGFALLRHACAAGDGAACAWGAGGDPASGDLIEGMRRGQAACDAGELDACEVVFSFTQIMACDDQACVERNDAEADALCARGAIEACRSIVEGHRPVGATAAAEQQLSIACTDGDADACAPLPGRAIPPAALCRAGDARACRDATAR